ncbi:MAG: DUF262 domain-containing protein [Planctomycetota bacterium]|nr:DUF262 domain-containing protein [Planctomycetota bacterium]
MNPTITLKPISDLLSETFFVPSYQRGFRWTRRQVTDLLDDVWEFQSKADTQDRASFYCLQPVVVKRRDDGRWELVDGQQRVTTIYLLLTYLQTLVEAMGKSRFSLAFETRSTTSGAFLQKIDKSQRHDNIDNHHICAAYEAMEEWFGARDGSHKFKFVQCLLNDDEVGRNVKVIWYELPDAEDPIEAFTRLNVGKIPLTNAELIRALFLRSGNFSPGVLTLQQLKIAGEWDGIEKALQADSLWYFLHRGLDSPASRIEYLFQLIARESDVFHLTDDPYSTFHFYAAKMDAPAATAEAEWLKVKQYFMSLEEWFNDRVLYHLVGYLIHEGDSLPAIRTIGQSVAKSAFQRILKQRLFKRVIGGSLEALSDDAAVRDAVTAFVSDLEYGEDAAAIQSVLLLFNIATLLQNASSNARFPFDSYKRAQWDIEHVRSVASGKPLRHDARRQWLEHSRDYLRETHENDDLCRKADAMLSADDLDGAQFDQLYHDFLKYFGEADDADTDNSLANLALLDAGTNRSYRNAVFPLKRRQIIGLDRVGTFVPLCTKNVFLKCYSRNIHHMLSWQKDDRKDYLDAIISMLSDFFAGAKGGTT